MIDDLEENKKPKEDNCSSVFIEVLKIPVETPHQKLLILPTIDHHVAYLFIKLHYHPSLLEMDDFFKKKNFPSSFYPPLIKLQVTT